MDSNQSLAKDKCPPDLAQSLDIQQCGISNAADVQLPARFIVLLIVFVIFTI